jgi:hypothetical protein
LLDFLGKARSLEFPFQAIHKCVSGSFSLRGRLKKNFDLCSSKLVSNKSKSQIIWNIPVHASNLELATFGHLPPSHLFLDHLVLPIDSETLDDRKELDESKGDIGTIWYVLTLSFFRKTPILTCKKNQPFSQ